MRVNLEWLNELVDLTGISVKDLVDHASNYSIEIETVEDIVKASNIVIGHVLTKTAHPDSDHLNVLTVDVKNEVLQIVCGAANVEAGQYVIVALVGAKLPGGEIKDSKIRGVESHGMVCSLEELGIEKKYIPQEFANGIYYFKDKVEVGSPASAALGFPSPVITLGLTPNRGDLLSMLGVAIEFSAAFSRPLKPLVYKYLRSNDENKDLSVKIESDKCLSYYAQEIRNIKIDESPRWLKSRLIAFGVRPINNVVDITNYIMALFGQPLHAFDADVLGNTILIRNAHDKEKIVTLDGETRELLDTDLLITDGKKPVALAGVMGGLDSEITDKTKNIIIEAAVFDPLTIRKTAARLFLHSEASNRYERGVDLNRTLDALEYTNYLFTTLCGASIDKFYIHEGIEKIEDKVIDLSSYNVNHILGSNLSLKEIEDILLSLGFKVTKEKEILHVSVPNRRPDITIMQDLVEEVARLYGYEKLVPSLPETSLEGGLTVHQLNEQKVEDVLSKSGLYGVISYSLVKDSANLEFLPNHIEEGSDVCLLMPLTEEHKILRQSLMPSIVDCVAYNHSRKNKDCNIFELGKVYAHVGEEYKEEFRLAGAMSGVFASTLHSGKMEVVDFYLVKGIINNLFAYFGIDLTFVPLDKECKELHPTRSASIYWNDTYLGFMGELHPRYAKEKDVSSSTYVFEFKMDEVLSRPIPQAVYTPVIKLPSVERDIALVVSKDVLASSIVASIKKSDKDLLSNVSIFDVYTGDKVKDDEKSIALKLTFSSANQLTDEVIAEHMKKILKDLKYRCNATLREE